MGHPVSLRKSAIHTAHQLTLFLVPYFPGLFSHQFQQFFITSLSAKPDFTALGNLVKIQKFVIQTIFPLFCLFGNQTGHIAGNTIGPQIFHNTDPFIALLHIKTVHKFIGHNGITDAFADLMIIQGCPFGSKFRFLR